MLTNNYYRGLPTCSLRIRVYNNIDDNECLIYINMPTVFAQAGLLKYIGYLYCYSDYRN